jgi:7-cyano-7-deazaguanine synthase in queuosine biosynthesis
MNITTKIINTGTAWKNKKRRVEDYFLVKNLSDLLKKKRGYIVKMPNPGTPVTICVSGGIDSIPNLFILMEKFKLNVYPCFLDRKQTNYKYEVASIKFFDSYFKKKFPKIYHGIKKIKLETPSKDYKDLLRATKNLQDNILMRRDVSYPARNPIIFLTGMEYAYSLQSQGISIKTVFGAFPNSDFLYHSSLTALRALNVLACHITHDWNWQFISIPIEEEFGNCYDKEVYIKYCLERGVPLERTRSCPKGGKLHCGTCIACWDRRNAFKQTGFKDKTPYKAPMPKDIPFAYKQN